MIAIIDYGMGNIHSVQKALQHVGGETIVTNNTPDIENSDKVVLPGVGAYDDAVLELKKSDLIPALNKHIKQKKPFLGICLGMQLLFESSEEARNTYGLGILKGVVKKFKVHSGLKVPHIGWNQVKIKKWACPLLKGIPDSAYVYFCHSYYPVNELKQVVAATTEYGVDFTSLIWQDNLYGVQFHPEKSQEVGLRILENFVKL